MVLFERCMQNMIIKFSAQFKSYILARKLYFQYIKCRVQFRDFLFIPPLLQNSFFFTIIIDLI